MNKVILIGRITNDIEIRYLNNQQQTPMVAVNVALDRYGKEGADFPRVKIFGKQAENLHKYCIKGNRIGVEGRIHTDSYQSDGRTVYVTEVIADRVEFLDYKPKDTAEASPEDIPADSFQQLDADIPF